MSNTICVKINNKEKYLSFRWSDNKSLIVFYNNNWIEVENTKNKNKYGEFIFKIKERF
jgi:hypothetical protein